MKPVITITINPSIDKSCWTERVVADDKLRCDQVRLEPGGGGVNVSRALHKLGGAAETIWTQGGITGELLARLLDGEALSHTPVPIQAMSRENLTVFESRNGAQYRFVMPGPRLTPAEVDAVIEAVGAACSEAAFVVASGSLPPGAPADFYRRVVDVAAARHAQLILDTSGEGLRATLGSGVYLVKPNLRELAQLTGGELETEDAMVEAAQDVVRRGDAKVVVVSIGAGGALVATEDRAQIVRSPTVPIRSKIGAGDSMVAGITFALQRDWPLLEAVRFGVAAGASAVQTPGTELCDGAETERLYETMRERTAA